MKYPLSWHKDGLTNALRSLEQRDAAAVRDVLRAQADIARRCAEINRCQAQIAEAERRGLDGFDPDKFLEPRSKS